MRDLRFHARAGGARNMAGVQCGAWYVIRQAATVNGNARWLCRHECGNQQILEGIRLRSRPPKYCDQCRPFQRSSPSSPAPAPGESSLVGHHFGLWFVVDLAALGVHGPRYVCRHTACGHEQVIDGGTLQRQPGAVLGVLPHCEQCPQPRKTAASTVPPPRARARREESAA